MSTETKYYEWVKASEELPESWHLVPVRFIHTKMPIFNIENLLGERPKSTPYIIEWLRPVNLSDIIREAVGKGFDAGMQREFDNQFGSVPTKAPDKETYLNNL